jgi:hypothetical protein
LAAAERVVEVRFAVPVLLAERDPRFAALFFAAVFLPVDALLDVFFAADFFAVDFLLADFLAVEVFAVDFLAVDFLAVDFFPAAFLAVDFLPPFAPPSCLFTVAQARRPASLLLSPFSS